MSRASRVSHGLEDIAGTRESDDERKESIRAFWSFCSYQPGIERVRCSLPLSLFFSGRGERARFAGRAKRLKKDRNGDLRRSGRHPIRRSDDGAPPPHEVRQQTRQTPHPHRYSAPFPLKSRFFLHASAVFLSHHGFRSSPLVFSRKFWCRLVICAEVCCFSGGRLPFPSLNISDAAAMRRVF
ncbi:hypothetical protein ACLOJK_009131 [Asimina triloba]